MIKVKTKKYQSDWRSSKELNPTQLKIWIHEHNFSQIKFVIILICLAEWVEAFYVENFKSKATNLFKININMLCFSNLQHSPFSIVLKNAALYFGELLGL